MKTELPAKKLLIVGFGYLGQRVARLAAQAGWQVFATSRRPEKRELIESAGAQCISFDITKPETLANLPAADAWLWCPAFDRKQGLSATQVITGGLMNAVLNAPFSPARIVYTSTTSVYHQSSGEWVDEMSPTAPETESGKANLEAENAILDWAEQYHRQAIVLRLSGLYGPDRSIRRASIEAGEPIPCDPDTWLNLLHIDDAAKACLMSIESEKTGRYCVTDDRPILRREFYETMAMLLNAPNPTFTPPVSADFAGNKRVSNALVKQELGWQPDYSDINAGLPGSLNQA